MEHEELAGYCQPSVNVKATLIVDCDPPPPFPSLAPEAMVWAEFESVNCPEAQLPVAPFASVNALQLSLIALTGTAGQLASVAETACTVTDQFPVGFPLIPHCTEAVLLPLTGVTS